MITSISEDVTRTHRRHQTTPLDIAYRQLHSFIDKIDEKIVNRLQLFQQIYAQDYKQQVQKMSEELYSLRANLDSEILKQKSSQRLFILQEERDFFRMQTMKLNDEVNQYAEENKNLKKKIIDLEVGNTNLKTIAYNYQKKLQKLKNQRNQIAVQMKIKRQSSVPLLKQPTFVISEENKYKQYHSRPIKEEQVESGSQISHPVKQFERKASKTTRTKTFSKLQTATKASIRRYEQIQQKDHILDQCIKQIKKNIFLRLNDQKTQNNYLFQEFQKISLQKFTKTDKKNLIFTILSNQKMLEEFNEYLTARGSVNSIASHANSRITKTKLSDDKYNQKFLIDLKRSFNKKIYELKASDVLRQSQNRKL